MKYCRSEFATIRSFRVDGTGLFKMTCDGYESTQTLKWIDLGLIVSQLRHKNLHPVVYFSSTERTMFNFLRTSLAYPRMSARTENVISFFLKAHPTICGFDRWLRECRTGKFLFQPSSIRTQLSWDYSNIRSKRSELSFKRLLLCGGATLTAASVIPWKCDVEKVAESLGKFKIGSGWRSPALTPSKDTDVEDRGQVTDPGTDSRWPRLPFDIRAQPARRRLTGTFGVCLLSCNVGQSVSPLFSWAWVDWLPWLSSDILTAGNIGKFRMYYFQWMHNLQSYRTKMIL